MTVSILRTTDAWWVQTPTGAARVTTMAATTRELLADRAGIEAAGRSTDTVPVDSLQLLSPGRHRQTPPRAAARLRGGDRSGHRPRYACRHHDHRSQPLGLRLRAG